MYLSRKDESADVDEDVDDTDDDDVDMILMMDTSRVLVREG